MNMPTAELFHTLAVAGLWLSGALLLTGVGLLLRRGSLRRRSADRLFVSSTEPQDSAEGDAPLSGHPIRRFLSLAGVFSPWRAIATPRRLPRS